MSLASILKRDIAGREARAKHDTGAAKAKDESLIHRWEGELLHPVEHTVPHPRAGIDYAYGEPRLVELRLGFADRRVAVDIDIRIAVQRRQRTSSFRITTARTVRKNGVDRLTAVATANWVCESATR